MNNDEKTFNEIFMDAHIKDIDLSRWDVKITLCVIALAFSGIGRKRLPIFLVDFNEPYDFSCKFNNHQETPGVGIFQWTGYRSTLGRDGKNRYLFSLSGSPLMPTLGILFKSFNILEISPEDLDATYPLWDKPGGPFIRAGIRRSW